MSTETLSIIGTQIGAVVVAAIYAYNTKKALIKATLSNDKKMKVLHELANARMGAALKFGMMMADLNAKRTKDPGDVALAAEARKMYEEHERNQAIVDAAADDAAEKPE